MLAISTRDHLEIDSALQEIRNEHPRAAEILEQLVAPHRALANRELLTTGQVARILDVTPQTVRNWVDAGWLSSRKRNPFGRRLIEAAALVRVSEFRSARDRIAATTRTIGEEEAAQVLSTVRAGRSAAKVGGSPR